MDEICQTYIYCVTGIKGTYIIYSHKSATWIYYGLEN